MIGALNETVFIANSDKVLTFKNGLTRKRDTRIVEHAVIGGKPKAEFQGIGLETIDLTIVLSAQFGVSPKDEAKRLRDYQEVGEICPLVIGEEFLGDFLITSISEEFNQIFKDGAVIRSTLNISLKEYA